MSPLPGQGSDESPPFEWGAGPEGRRFRVWIFMERVILSGVLASCGGLLVRLPVVWGGCFVSYQGGGQVRSRW